MSIEIAAAAEEKSNNILIMESKVLAKFAKLVISDIKSKIALIKESTIFTSETKRLNKLYAEELYDNWLAEYQNPEFTYEQNFKMEQELENNFIKQVKKLATNTSGKSEHFRIVELQQLLQCLNSNKDYNGDRDSYSMKVNLTILQFYPM